MAIARKKQDLKISTRRRQKISKKFIPNRNSTRTIVPSESTSIIDKTCQELYMIDFKEICGHY